MSISCKPRLSSLVHANLTASLKFFGCSTYQVIAENGHVQEFISSLISRLVVEADEMAAETAVIDLVLGVEDEEDEVEPGEEGVRQLDVLDDGALVVPLRLDRVGRGQDGGSGVELADDAGLGDGQRLLLHHFVKNRPGGITHLEKNKKIKVRLVLD